MHKNNLSIEEDCVWAIPTFDKPQLDDDDYEELSEELDAEDELDSEIINELDLEDDIK